MTELFSTREIATGIWTAIIILLFVLIVKSKSFRLSAHDVLHKALNKHIVIFLIIFIAYAVLWIVILSNLALWDWTYLKVIAFWNIFIGIPLCFNAITSKDEFYFRGVVKSNFTFIVFLEFLIGTFTFSFVIEMVLVPLASVLYLFHAVATTDKAYKPLEKIFSFFQVMLGFIIIYSAVRSAVKHYTELNSLDLVITYSIPVVMTFLFLPLAYMYAIYSEYDSVFKEMQFRLPRDNTIKIKAKWKVFKVCKLSRRKVRIFKKNYLSRIYKRMSEKDFDDIIEEFWLSYKNYHSVIIKLRLLIF